MFGMGKGKKRGDSRRKIIRVLISEGCVVEGGIASSSSMRIDGRVRGMVNGKSAVIVGEKGLASGEVKAFEVIVFGSVDGTIEAQRVEIKAGGNVSGDIITKSLIVEDGAIYNGKCFMEQASAKPEASTPQQETPPHLKVQK